MTTQTNPSNLGDINSVIYAGSGGASTPDTKGGGGQGPKSKPKKSKKK